MGHFAIEDQHAVLHGAGLGDEHGQNPARGKAGKVNMLKHLTRS